MIFYNGFNLLVDLILVFVVYVIAHGIGFRRGLNKNKPPFQACWFDTPQKWGRACRADRNYSLRKYRKKPWKFFVFFIL